LILFRRARRSRRAGLDANRVALIIYVPPIGRERRASGYRVTDTHVLTAMHAVDGVGEITVRFSAGRPDKWEATGRVLWADRHADGAILQLHLPPEAPPVKPVGYGRVAQRVERVGATAVGFPYWNLQDPSLTRPGQGKRYRDTHQAHCDIPPLSGLRSGNLELMLSPPGKQHDEDHTPWEGMSGAAVWVGKRVVGVIHSNPRDGGLNRLAATRMERLIASMPVDVRQALSVDGRDTLVDVPVRTSRGRGTRAVMIGVAAVLGAFVVAAATFWPSAQSHGAVSPPPTAATGASRPTVPSSTAASPPVTPTITPTLAHTPGSITGSYTVAADADTSQWLPDYAVPIGNGTCGTGRIDVPGTSGIPIKRGSQVLGWLHLYRSTAADCGLVWAEFLESPPEPFSSFGIVHIHVTIERVSPNPAHSFDDWTSGDESDFWPKGGLRLSAGATSTFRASVDVTTTTEPGQS
jgi:hypothetical protein